MRVGIAGLLHESNTFVHQPTTLDHFRQDLFLTGDAVAEQLHDSHHEVGGFFAGLEAAKQRVTAVPLAAFRATPSGKVTASTFSTLVAQLLAEVERAQPLDGLLVAAHGAAVCEAFPDADGQWLQDLRHVVGADLPIVATLDAHANLSPAMVAACDALVGYRTNPHLDQHDRGREAAQLLVDTLLGRVRPTMAAAYLPLVINIERQCTEEAHLRPPYELADRLLDDPAVLSNSILLGFPYADVIDLGAATVVVTNNAPEQAASLATDIAAALWECRHALEGQLLSITEAIGECRSLPGSPVCLLDMGDNVGGGSAADSTVLAQALTRAGIGPSFGCICDPDSVAQCTAAGVGAEVDLRVGGKTDQQHGPPWCVRAKVLSLTPGSFRELRPRHGGIVQFHQGPTAVVRSLDGQATLMLTTRRVPPFSLSQLTSQGIDPAAFRVLIAKGVHAPLAAYREVCPHFLRVNTIGATCADLSQLTFHHRRRPLFPFEQDAAGPVVPPAPGD